MPASRVPCPLARERPSRGHWHPLQRGTAASRAPTVLVDAVLLRLLRKDRKSATPFVLS